MLLLLAGLVLGACSKGGEKAEKAGHDAASPATAKEFTPPSQPLSSAEERLRQLEQSAARLEQENRQLQENQVRLEQANLQREQELARQREDEELRRLAQQERDRLREETARKDALQARQAADNYRSYVIQLAALPTTQLNQMLLGCGGKSVPDTQQRYELCAAIQDALPAAADRESAQAATLYQDQVSTLSQYGSADLRARLNFCSNAPYLGSNTRYSECAAVAEALDYVLQRERNTQILIAPYPVPVYRPGRHSRQEDERHQHERPQRHERDEKHEYTFTPAPGQLQQPRLPQGGSVKPANP